MKFTIIIAAALIVSAIVIIHKNQSIASAVKSTTRPATQNSRSEWKKILPPDTYHIMFEYGTERPFANAYYNNHEEGTYVSAATGAALFNSRDKYESGTGWPSFTKPVTDDAVIIRPDPDGSGRDEVIDASSGGHLGHVFDDGPQPTGKRFCMNSGALKFVPLKK